MKAIIATACFLLAVLLTNQQNITLNTGTGSILMASDGVRSEDFYQYRQEMDCGMPELYIFEDSTHANYTIQSSACVITSIQGTQSPIQSNITCSENGCTAEVSNLCPTAASQINQIKLETSLGELEYLVNCNPDKFYKPFQWGLLLLIMLTTLVLTLASLYSKAWSYGGVGYEISNRAIVIFNVTILVFMVLGFMYPEGVALAARVVGTVVGALGVSVCVSETIWLTHNKNYQKKIYKRMRLIDVISLGVGLAFIPLYWLLNGQWFVNDIMAVCTIVALMKLLKVTSLSIAVNLLASLLVLEIVVGVVVHYVLKISYNNYIINLFQNPIMLVMPSITQQIYRRCAWLPITAALFPGLVLSYLRRFDKTRGTYLYLLIGLGSFYFGSLCWMLVDLQTVHSLPFAIISEPIIVLIVVLHSIRRNEFKTLWRGSFHDQELNEGQVMLSKETEIVGPTPSAYVDLTADLRVSGDSSNYEALIISQEYKL